MTGNIYIYIYTYVHTHTNLKMHAEMLVSNPLRKKALTVHARMGQKNTKVKETIKMGRGRGEFKASLCSKEIVVGLHT
jgi:hypothetical protein